MSLFQFQSSEVLARLKPFGITFEKSLNDLIKGIRAHSKDSPESLLTFLDKAINECKDELVSTDLEVKAIAVLKLAYLEMYGFDMSWCNFRILEVMSSSKFQQKRIGYLAASQSFKSEQELLILATNQFKKDLNSHNHVEIGLALSGIATIVTAGLAQDIIEDVLMKLSHSKPYIRKKAILCLFKIFLQYPESLSSCLPRVIEKLDDPDVAVVSATITIICEISKKNPNIFIGYLPKFFTILEDTSNNWLIIRILKLFQSLLKIEPRMKKRIMPSIVALMSKTDATSLIYECINCLVDGGMILSESSKDKEIAKVCIEHLLRFFTRGDANLKFVGLLALIKILHIFPIFIHKIPQVGLVIKNCLRDSDLIIKRKALDICHYLVTEDNIADLVKILLMQLLPENTSSHPPEAFVVEITNKILHIASMNNYANIPNFRWYATVLKELVNLTLLSDSSKLSNDGRIPLTDRTKEIISGKIGTEFQSLAIKVPSIQPFIMAKVVSEYVGSTSLLELCPELAKNLYWIMGEYVDQFGKDSNDEQQSEETIALSRKVTVFNQFVNGYLDLKLSNGVHFHIAKSAAEFENADMLVSLIDALIKLYSSIVTDYAKLYARGDLLPEVKHAELAYFLKKLIFTIEGWESHASYAVQERSSSWLEFLRLSADALQSNKINLEAIERQELEYYKDLFAKDDSEVSDSGMSDNKSGSENESEDEESSSIEPSEHELSNLLEVDDDNETQSSEGKKEDPDRAELHDARKSLTEFPLPTLLKTILPSFFKSNSINPVSSTAQLRIPLPSDLDLDSEIHANPLAVYADSSSENDDDAFSDVSDVEPEPVPSSHRVKERLTKLKDDPYYITSTGSKSSSRSERKKALFQPDLKSSGSELTSEISGGWTSCDDNEPKQRKTSKGKKMKKEKVLVLAEENFDDGSVTTDHEPKTQKQRKNKLIIDSLDFNNVELGNAASVTDFANKGFEYEVDLAKLRAELAGKAEKDLAKELRKMKKKQDQAKARNAKHVTETLDERLSVETGTGVGQDVGGSVSPSEAALDLDNAPETTKTSALDPKKKRKKKKAVIVG